MKWAGGIFDQILCPVVGRSQDWVKVFPVLSPCCPGMYCVISSGLSLKTNCKASLKLSRLVHTATFSLFVVWCEYP